jgi:glutamate--cysteine ligase
VSTHIGVAVANAEPVTAADLVAYFHRTAKPATDWRVGAEFEKFGVERASGRPLTYHGPDGIRAILEGLSQRFGWAPFVNEAGFLTALVRGQATISLEPGGQVELSTSPALHVGGIADELDGHLAELRAVADPERVAWLAAGVSPLCRAEQIPLGPRVRHAVMAEYLPQRSPTALEMMKATASTQATFDFGDETDASRKFTLTLTLSPLVNALWGNGPLYGGSRTGDVSYRGRVWQHMDPDRSGLLTPLLTDGLSFARYVDYLLDVPMLFTRFGGRYQAAGGRTFRDFLEHGLEGRFPSLADWELHLTTVFPEVRLKGFLEVRGADACARPLALAVPAFWKGLLYDADTLAAATELARAIRVADLPELFEAAFRYGLATWYAGRTLREWCADLVRLAAEGLRRQAERRNHLDERPFLDPVFAVLERGRSPGSEYLVHGPADPATPDEVVRWFAYT